jgi:hypothetical protein
MDEFNQQFNDWPTDRLLETLEAKIESDVPTEYKREINPLVTELRARNAVATHGPVGAKQFASQGSPQSI